MSTDDGRDWPFMGEIPERLERARIYVVTTEQPSEAVPPPKPVGPCSCEPGYRRLCFYRTKECPET